MTQHHTSRRRSALRLLVLALTLGLTAVGLSQCRLVSDTITGASLSNGRLGLNADCIGACNDAYKAALISEDDRYRAALDACGSDNECRRSVQVKHREILDSIRDDRMACKDQCYNEGGGRLEP